MLRWKTISTSFQADAFVKLQELSEDGTFRVVVRNGNTLYFKVFPCRKTALKGFQEGLKLINSPKGRKKTELAHSL